MHCTRQVRFTVPGRHACIVPGRHAMYCARQARYALVCFTVPGRHAMPTVVVLLAERNSLAYG